MTGPYAAVAYDLHRLGWSPLPLPPGQKAPPPAGLTGYAGRYPTEGQVVSWSRTHADGNVAIRLPADVVGVDVDAYAGGADGLAQLVEKFGPLPPTVMSTARTDGSGIRLFRVPAGTTFATDPAEGIDIVQAAHRYVVVQPSTNPKTKTPYRWIDEQSGEALDEAPDPGDLPEMPWAWVEGLCSEGKGRSADRAATPAEVADFVDAHTESRHPSMLKGLEDRLRNVTAGGRHDALVGAACWAAREAAAGCYPAATALDLLSRWWAEAVADDPRRRDGTEFGSAIRWAIAEASAAPERVAQVAADADDALGARGDVADLLGSIEPAAGDVKPEPSTASDVDPIVDLPSSWQPVDLRQAATTPPEPAKWLRRADGAALFYAGKTHWLMGESEGAKTWIALLAEREVLAEGGRVAHIDFEDEATTYLERMDALGVASEVLYNPDRVRFIRPTEPTPARQIAELVAWAPHFLTADGITGAFDLDGVNPDVGVDVARWMRLLLLPFARAGTTVLALDHVVKNKENRGRYAIGGVHKLNGVTGAAYTVEAIRPLSRAQLEPVHGLSRLSIAKDRAGWVRASVPGGGGAVADVALTAYPDGGVFAHVTKPGAGPADDSLTAKIAEHLFIYEGATKTALRRLGNSDNVDAALKNMVDGGLVAVTPVGMAHKHFLTENGRERFGTDE